MSRDIDVAKSIVCLGFWRDDETPMGRSIRCVLSELEILRSKLAGAMAAADDLKAIIAHVESQGRPWDWTPSLRARVSAVLSTWIPKARDAESQEKRP